MESKLSNRRQVMKGGARIAAGMALAGLTRSTAAAAQLPPSELLDDDRLTFVTTTEASSSTRIR